MFRSMPWLVVGALLALPLTAAGQAPPATGCYALKAESTGKYLTHGGLPLYNANRTEVKDWERFCVVRTHNNTVLIQNEKGAYVSARDGGIVQSAWLPGPWEEWQAESLGGNRFSLKNPKHSAWLSADRVLDGVVTTKGERREWEVWQLEPTNNCACDPTFDADIATNVEPPPQSGPVFGIADTHAHVFSNLGFGGYEFHGAASSPYGIRGALPICDYSHGPASATDIIGLANNDGPHDTEGAPGFAAWPAWNNVNHQQMYYKWIERAWRGGLRLQVQLAVDNELLCYASKVTVAAGYAAMVGQVLAGFHPPPPPDLKIACDDMDSIGRQVAGARALEAFIDARSGGRGKGWYRIVTTPAEAREVIGRGKLAVVLGVEVDTLFGCSAATPCTADQMKDRLGKLIDIGVRHVFPVHVLDNAFGGAAQYNWMFIVANVLKNGRMFRVEECADPTLTAKMWWAPNRQVCDALAKVPDFAGLIGDLCGREPPQWMAPPANARSHCNARGLTALGSDLINKLMDAHLVIDVDHMGSRTLEGTLAIAEARDYPLVGGHSGLVARTGTPSEAQKSDRDIKRIGALGGLVSPILHSGKHLAETKAYGNKVANDCAGSSKAWAQNYLQMVDAMGGPARAAVPLGSDLNGWVSQPIPRFGPHACNGDNRQGSNPKPRVAYPFAAHGVPGTFGKLVTGRRTFDYNKDGLANVGLLPDFIQDLKNVGLTDADLAPLFRSAEGYLQLWEKASRPHAGHTRVPLDANTPSLNWSDAVRYCAAQGKRLANRMEVCPPQMGAPRFGRPDGDVWMAVGDHENAWVSIGTKYAERKCTFHEDTYGARPAWGTDKGPQPVTQQAAAVRCVDYARVPLGVPPDGPETNAARTFNWSDAKASCERQGLRLASRADLCPNGANGEPRYGRVEGDVWLAVADHPNAWISVGTQYADERHCKLHEEVYGSAPSWGTSTGPEPVASRNPAAVVCLPSS
ncbi:MAG: membrane dipeptidase [Myxococcales bacterium]|nr:membrane dipeptidase [Myxococcales bacterium]